MVTTPPLAGVPVWGGTEPKAPGSVSDEDAPLAVAAIVVVAPATRTSAAAKAVPARAPLLSPRIRAPFWFVW